VSASSTHRSVDRPFDWSLLARNLGVDGSAPALSLDQDPFGWPSAWFIDDGVTRLWAGGAGRPTMRLSWIAQTPNGTVDD
jgi:hypothetical protein